MLIHSKLQFQLPKGQKVLYFIARIDNQNIMRTYIHINDYRIVAYQRPFQEHKLEVLYLTI